MKERAVSGRQVLYLLKGCTEPNLSSACKILLNLVPYLVLSKKGVLESLQRQNSLNRWFKQGTVNINSGPNSALSYIQETPLASVG